MSAQQPVSAQEPVGCIGLGKIGLPICRNLIASGFQVVGHRRASLATFEAIGGTPASSAADVATRSTVVLTCVDSDAAMDAVICGPGGLAQGVRPGQIVVCLSSHPVAVKKAFAATLAKRGAVLLDGEVSGTPGMVEARKAAVYLAGSQEATDIVTPVIRGFTDTCLYLGPFGGATQVKLVNNFLAYRGHGASRGDRAGARHRSRFDDPGDRPGQRRFGAIRHSRAVDGGPPLHAASGCCIRASALPRNDPRRGRATGRFARTRRRPHRYLRPRVARRRRSRRRGTS